MLVVLALVFTALVTPYEVAFLVPTWDGLFAVNRLIDLVFLKDPAMICFKNKFVIPPS